jgi:hypothetical protein
MAKARKRYRVILAYGNYRVGDIIEPNAAFADRLMGKTGGGRFIEPIPVMPVMDEPIEPVKRKRGRPRKHPLPDMSET